MKGILPETWSPYLRSVLRMTAALTFMTHGTVKLFGVPALEPRTPVELFSQAGLAGVLEVFGGLLMLVGLFTKPVAFILSGEMAVAVFQAHLPRAFWPILNGGEPAYLFCFIFLYFAAAGPGPWSLDALRARSSR